MRKSIVSILLLGLVAGAFSAVPALAKKKKTVTVHQEFTAGPHLPLPGQDVPGCSAGEETIHKTTIPYKTPAKGLLSVEMGDFQADWDLYVYEGGNIIAASEGDQTGGGAPTEQIMINLGAKKNIEIVACSWAGGPTASGHFMYKYKK